jgi:hypothetical protein
VHQFAPVKIEADTSQHVAITAPNVDLLDAKTVWGDAHGAAIVAKSKS